MKTVKIIVLALALLFAGVVYATEGTKSSLDKANATTAACCKAGADCCVAGAACCVPDAACCKDGAACKADAGCCASSEVCSKDTGCCTAQAACCTTDKCDMTGNSGTTPTCCVAKAK